MVSVNCPSCGAPVGFRAQHTLYAVCSACHTLLVRQDVEVKDLGKVSDLQPDGTPLRIGTQGSYRGKPFEILGRIQVQIGDGFWNEWFLLYADGREGWLGEAMGEYMVTFPSAQAGLAEYSDLAPGTLLQVGREYLVVTQKSISRVVSFEGELPFVMQEAYELRSADLRGAQGQAGTIDYSEGKPVLFLGQYQNADELAFSGLRVDDEDQPSTPGVRAKGFKCPSCGAPHELKAGALSKVLICEYCDAAIDTSNNDFAKLYQFQQQNSKVPALIPLGSKATFDKVTWECLGFMRRSVRVDGINYSWSEYLLYERMHGYRWLTETNGHWVYLQPLPSVPHQGPLPVGVPPTATIEYAGVSFKHFQRANARVDYVVGEFYWRVKVGDEALTDDYVAPPRMLCAEGSSEGFVWSHGVYKAPAEIWEAFGLSGQPPEASSTPAPAQPNRYRATRNSMWRSYGIYAGLGLVLMLFFSFKSSDPLQTFSFDCFKYEPERSRVTKPFRLTGRTSNVKIRIQTEFVNRWAFFQLSLINLDTNVALDTGQTVSYYRDDEGSYGSTSDSVLLPRVPSGQYILRIEPQSGTGDNPDTTNDPKAGEQRLFHYTIQIYRDVPEWGFYWALVGLLLLPPLWATWKSSSFETRRWAESDYAPGGE